MRAFAAKGGETSKGTAAGKEKAEKMIRRKKMMAVLTVLAILTGSLGMTATASAAAESETHEHNAIYRVEDGTYSTTSTHPVWVANKPNGEPILATCTVTYKWQRYKYICRSCGEEVGTGSEEISETHSMHH